MLEKSPLLHFGYLLFDNKDIQIHPSLWIEKKIAIIQAMMTNIQELLHSYWNISGFMVADEKTVIYFWIKGPGKSSAKIFNFCAGIKSQTCFRQDLAKPKPEIEFH